MDMQTIIICILVAFIVGVMIGVSMVRPPIIH